MQERILVATSDAIYLDCSSCGLPSLYQPLVDVISTGARQYDGCTEQLTKITPLVQQTIQADDNLALYHAKRWGLVELFGKLDLTALTLINPLFPHWLQGATLSFEEPDKIAYAVDLQDTFDSSLRRKVRFSKFLDRLLSTGVLSSMPDNQAARLCQEWSRLTSLMTPKFTFSIEAGEAIAEAYLKGPNSCMSGINNSIQLYAKNPEKVSVLRIATKYDPFHGRALLWTLDNGQRFLDRIYPDDNGVHIELAQNYAKKQGWLWRCGGLTHTTVYNPDGSEHGDTLSVTLRNCNAWPFLDTLAYLVDYRHGSNEIQLQNNSPHFGSYTILHETNGELPSQEEEEEEEEEEDDRPICDCCEEPSDAVESHTVCRPNNTYSVDYCDDCSANAYTCDDCSHLMSVSHVYTAINAHNDSVDICWCCLANSYIQINGTYYHTILVGTCLISHCTTLILRQSDTHPFCQNCFDTRETTTPEQTEEAI